MWGFMSWMLHLQRINGFRLLELTLEGEHTLVAKAATQKAMAFERWAMCILQRHLEKSFSQKLRTLQCSIGLLLAEQTTLEANFSCSFTLFSSLALWKVAVELRRANRERMRMAAVEVELSNERVWAVQAHGQLEGDLQVVSGRGEQMANRLQMLEAELQGANGRIAQMEHEASEANSAAEAAISAANDAAAVSASAAQSAKPGFPSHLSLSHVHRLVWLWKQLGTSYGFQIWYSQARAAKWYREMNQLSPTVVRQNQLLESASSIIDRQFDLMQSSNAVNQWRDIAQQSSDENLNNGFQVTSSEPSPSRNQNSNSGADYDPIAQLAALRNSHRSWVQDRSGRVGY